ncbi:serine/threonine-protein kinase [Streptomyces sp. V4-01]|uniref:non-specific serine/threonine protein kinase n=1 Tax=Actinacidiphila polyblastidii TaxID=3110430 RepID=A0ABU7PE10_9ACTN|nr:serine/threonine-protein kinase [Streptomyces sp. V4-01]
MSLRRRPESAPVDGRLIDKRYRLAEKLGSGGMGAVWIGHDTRFGREVALKEAHFDADGPDAAARIERIMREARAAARIDHPAVVTIHDVVMHDGRPWIVMERIRGESLGDRLKSERRLSDGEAARIAGAVAEALGAAHARGVLHRDVKPANVLLGPSGRVVLTDFGIARIQGERSLTRSGEFVGSLEYTAPERMGSARPGAAADLWSLGVMLFRMVEGWSPFRRTTVHATVTAVLTADMPRPVQTTGLAPLIMALLDRNPAGRPTADDAAAVLRSLAQPSPEQAANARESQIALPAVAGSVSRRPRKELITGVIAAAVAGTALTLVAASILHGASDPSSSSTPSATVTGRSPRPSLRASTAPSPASGYDRVIEAAFTVDLPRGWKRRGPASGPTFTFTAGDCRVTIVAGQDSARFQDGDPLEYQLMEPELAAFRNSTWSNAYDLKLARIHGREGAQGTYFWRDGKGLSLYAENTVLVADGRFHVILVEGPDTPTGRDLVYRVAKYASQTYTPQSTAPDHGLPSPPHETTS